MQLVKKFMHPIHMVNYFNAMMKRSLMSYTPKRMASRPVPYLFQEVSYYFTFVTQARNELNEMVYALCCFSHDGEIIFSHQASFDCSLWHYRRMGMAATAKKIEGTIRSAFKRHNVPLNPNNPFSKVEENLYWCNVCWFTYKKLLQNQ